VPQAPATLFQELAWIRSPRATGSKQDMALDYQSSRSRHKLFCPLPCFDVSFVFSMLWFGCSSSLATQQMQDLLSSSVVSVMLDDVVSSISTRKVLYFLLESEFQTNAIAKGDFQSKCN
jgi:hypothetical protein